MEKNYNRSPQMSKSLKKLDKYLELEDKFSKEATDISRRHNLILAKSYKKSLNKLVKILKKYNK